MKKERIFLLLSLILILILLFISSSINLETMKGKIKSVLYESNRIVIQLENNKTKIIIFTSKILNLKQGQDISVLGCQEIWKNQTQFVADKIILQNA